MVKKNCFVTPLFMIAVAGPGFLTSCATKKARPPHSRVAVDSTLEEPAPDAPPAIGSENLPPDQVAPAAAPSLADVEIGVYVDSIGYDAFSALGFLQQLEKASIKPTKIVGTGFGCWVALSWALENSGNRAEWQSFKWVNWEVLPQKGFLNRLKGAIGAEGRFADEVNKHFQIARFKDLKGQADCPLVANQSPYSLRSAHDFDLAHALWIQFLHPALAVPESAADSEKDLSGAFAGFPKDAEWDDLSRDLPTGARPVLWLYLKTRTDAERRLGVENLPLLNLRPEVSGSIATKQPQLRRTAGGNYWMVIDLTGAKRGPELLKNLGARRKFLLDGRKMGRQMVDSKQIEKSFGDLFSAAPPLASP